MKLAIFDIDGTLTETNHVDSACFVQALADAHSITGVSTDWAEYPHTTDSAITRHIYQERFARPPSPDELSRFKKQFVELLDEYRRRDPGLFGEVRGASSAVARLGREPGWAIAIASGAWRVSAELKLKAAGIGVGSFPSAFADDGLSREEILRAAVSRAQEAYGASSFARIVSVGDGLWDVRAARHLALPFLGVAAGERERTLRREGATHVIEDFSDYDRLIRYLNEAETPPPR